MSKLHSIFPLNRFRGQDENIQVLPTMSSWQAEVHGGGSGAVLSTVPEAEQVLFFHRTETEAAESYFTQPSQSQEHQFFRSSGLDWWCSRSTGGSLLVLHSWQTAYPVSPGATETASTQWIASDGGTIWNHGTCSPVSDWEMTHPTNKWVLTD